MRYTKAASTYEQQLALLEGRGLVVPNRDRALRWLRAIGYYRLSAYCWPFRIPGKGRFEREDRFQPGTTFDQVAELYKFDAQLRLLIMQAIDRIEIAVRAAVTYQFAHILGPFGYADAANFTPVTLPLTLGSGRKGLDHAQFMRMLQRETAKSEEVFVKHFRNKYTLSPNLPIWMAAELITFGALAQLHENCSKAIRKQIGKSFGASQSQITSWVNSLAYIRNVCAHHARLWNREISIKPELTAEWKADGTKPEGIYCVFLVIDKMLSLVAPNDHWKDRLITHVLNSPFVSLRAMQFPDDWLELSPWNISKLES
jgi:abortive infection bacteriophage resistance protein